MKTLQVDNVAKFRSQTFEDYCTAFGISLTYCVSYEHNQNGLAEVYIKKLQMVARPLLLHARLLATLWGHAILHVASLFWLRPTLLNSNSLQELLTGHVPNIAHLQTFGCRVWAPRPKSQRKTISTHHEEGVYIGFDSPSIIRYLIPSTRTLLCARF